MAGAGDAAKEYVAGSVAGIAQVVVGHPFDTVKVYFFLSSHCFRYFLRMRHSLQIFVVLFVNHLPVSCDA